jgi:hypothetical protein
MAALKAAQPARLKPEGLLLFLNKEIKRDSVEEIRSG